MLCLYVGDDLGMDRSDILVWPLMSEGKGCGYKTLDMYPSQEFHQHDMISPVLELCTKFPSSTLFREVNVLKRKDMKLKKKKIVQIR